MANFLKLSTILSLMVSALLLASQYPTAFSSEFEDEDDDELEEYVLDAPNPNFRLRGRFFVSIIKKGAHCDAVKYNICNGVRANNGTSILNCCKTHCRNILGDRNNCGKCGNKCKFAQRCCNGKCTNVAYNPKHCGKCTRKCSAGVKCEYGYCGYA
ncbi:protein GRIM REAPER [Argentina anserina]|uniref:protein GRIM REAPER n=1 Tax=Argentina anserina TaxID=57926 RepID=UPI0021767818|nr:protein GRIM REAPER [Potentilla anserina]